MVHGAVDGLVRGRTGGDQVIIRPLTRPVGVAVSPSRRFRSLPVAPPPVMHIGRLRRPLARISAHLLCGSFAFPTVSLPAGRSTAGYAHWTASPPLGTDFGTPTYKTKKIVRFCFFRRHNMSSLLSFHYI